MRRPAVTVSGDDGPQWSPSDETRQSFGLQVNGVASPRAPRIDGSDVQVMYKVIAGPWVPAPSSMPTWQFIFSRPISDVVSASYFPYVTPNQQVALTSGQIDDLWGSGGNPAFIPDNPAGMILSSTGPLIANLSSGSSLVVTLLKRDADGNPTGTTFLRAFYSSWMGVLDPHSRLPAAPTLGSIIAVPLDLM